MKTMFKITLAMAILFALTAFVHAQHSLADEHAVYEMFEVQGMRQQLNQAMSLTLQNQVQAMPQLKKHQNEFMMFFIKTIGYDALKKDLAGIYLKHFTVEEIREITKFYRSPVGQKMKKMSYPMMLEVNRLASRKLEKEMPAFLENMKKKGLLK